MKESIKKADVLIEALPYIQQFRNEIIVIKFGGSAMEDKKHVDGILADITFMECVGMLPVVVHGGGKAISRSMKEHGIEAKFVKGLRVTCEKTINVVQKVMNEEINPGIVVALREMGANADGLHGEDIFSVVRKKEINPETGEEIDFGYVGEPHGVDTGPIRLLLDKGIIPVITPLGIGPDGKVHNINADTAAGAVAKALKARKLAYLSDVPGLLSNPKDPESLLTTLRLTDIEELINKGVIDGGMRPKVLSGVEALRAGVKKVHMIDGRMPHSLLLEIFTDKGVGTEIIRDE
ncbi:MAG: acetylglutamate kinase [Kiritimatiellae bacterium]|nr:acetylglutamate kinase [Kiritimatiellia bacterium]MDD5521223.1 acetylglutamate kinase [Kiritimatiellia bacterium]